MYSILIFSNLHYQVVKKGQTSGWFAACGLEIPTVHGTWGCVGIRICGVAFHLNKDSQTRRANLKGSRWPFMEEIGDTGHIANTPLALWECREEGLASSCHDSAEARLWRCVTSLRASQHTVNYRYLDVVYCLSGTSGFVRDCDKMIFFTKTVLEQQLSIFTCILMITPQLGGFIPWEILSH